MCSLQKTMASTSRILKKQRGLYLIGSTVDSISGSKLPSNRLVLARFLHLHTVDHQTISASAATTAEEIMHFWDRARIPTRLKCHIISLIRDLHARWVSLKKNSSRQTDTQRRKEEALKETFADLFDVAHANALTLIKIEEDRAFLLAQREKGRRGSMGSVDTILANNKQYQRRQRCSRARRGFNTIVQCSHNNTGRAEAIFAPGRGTASPRVSRFQEGHSCSQERA
jgi:hypothetical protein